MFGISTETFSQVSAMRSIGFMHCFDCVACGCVCAWSTLRSLYFHIVIWSSWKTIYFAEEEIDWVAVCVCALCSAHKYRCPNSLCYLVCLLHWYVCRVYRIVWCVCSEIGRDDNAIVGNLLLCFQLTEGTLIELNVIVSTASSMCYDSAQAHSTQRWLVCRSRSPNAGNNSLF